MSDASGLLLLHLLADREGRPGALRLQAAAPTAVTLESLRPLAARLPCLVPADQPDAAALIDAGAQLLREGTVAIGAPKATFEAEVKWLDGDWYLQPPPAGASQLSSSRALALKLMQLVASDADNHEIEGVFRQDPTLSYHLLRLVNSVAMGLRHHVTSFSQAIVLVGRQQLRRWLNFILFAARDDDPRSPMLLAHVAARARTLELLAHARGDDKAMQDEVFMIGMFSLLGVLFGQSLAEVLQPLKLSGRMQAALLRSEGRAGELLDLVATAERGDIETLHDMLTSQGIDPEVFSLAARAAHIWALELLCEAGGGHG